MGSIKSPAAERSAVNKRKLIARIIMHKKITKKGKKRKFIATVMERFSDTFEVWAENEQEARQIVNDGIPDEYSPVQTGGGYGRTIDIDPDFSN